MSLRAKVLATMKSSETESNFELYVTRTPGYLWALFFRALHVHPIVVTLLSIVIGCASGYCFYFDNLRMNLLGILLLVWANWYDCADGQLARLTGQKTLVGRLLDGLAGDLWFFCIYLALCLRFHTDWNHSWIWLLAAWSGLRCHGRQCAIADYYRNIHLYVLLGRDKSELDTSKQQRQRIQQLKWNKAGWFEKLYLCFYTFYTRGQEDQTPVFQRLKAHLDANCNGLLPSPQREAFLAGSRPLMKWCNILTFDARVALLFASILAATIFHQPLFIALHMLIESTLFEFIRFRTIRIHERLCFQALKEIS